MKQIPIRELNQQTSKIMERVKNGEVFQITERGKPIATIIPGPRRSPALERLIAEGRVTPATKFGPFPPPSKRSPGVNFGDIIHQMRDEERF